MVDIPGDSSTTQTITVGGAYSGSIEVGGDHDWIAITLTAGQSISIALDGSGASALADPYLRLRDSSGNLLAENDDGGLGTNSLLGFKATYTGVYYIDVSAWEDTTPGATQLTGDYQLRVSPYTPPPLGTVQQIAAQLTNDYWGGSSHHFAATQGGSISVNIGALTPDGQFLAREALRVWSDVIGVSFPEVSSGGQIVFSNDQDGASTGANWSRGIETSAHVNERQHNPDLILGRGVVDITRTRSIVVLRWGGLSISHHFDTGVLEFFVVCDSTRRLDVLHSIISR